MKKFLKSKLFIYTASVLLVLLLVFLGRQLYKRYLISQEVKQLEQEIAGLEQRNQEIAELIDYLKTDTFKERQARSLLGLQKEGEFVVALPQRNENQSASEKEDRADSNSNLKKWWKYFFGEQ